MVNRPIEVFISYCHKDDKLRSELQVHLGGLERDKLIKCWCDERIIAGDPLDDHIDEHLNSAQLILLLISPDYNDSHYCYEIEMPRAMERYKNGEAHVIPVILRHTEGWTYKPYGKLKALPKDGKPITDTKEWTTHDTGLHDLAFNNVVEGIRKTVLEKFGSAAGTPTAGSVAAMEQDRRPVVWNVPFGRNPNFTGRKEYLEKLRTALVSGKHAALTQTIHGLGGIGKTQLALEYAHAHELEYFAVWWIRSETPESLSFDFASLANELDLPDKNHPQLDAVIAAVRRWLERSADWLLIFDNAPDPGSIRPYLPTRGKGHIIITSRHPEWGGVAEDVSLRVMEEGEAAEFILKRTGAADRKAAADLATSLGCFPLALEQAASYIHETGMPLKKYMEICCEKNVAVLPGGCPTDYEKTVETTWEINFREVEKRSPAAAELLKLCSFFAPDNIPLQVIRDGADFLSEPLAGAVKDTLLLEEAAAALRRFSLIDRSDDTISIHRIVQAVTRQKMAEDEKKKWASAAICILNEVFPFESDEVQTWPVCNSLLPHTLAVIGYSETLDVLNDKVARLLNQMGLYLYGRADYSYAKNLFERAKQTAESLYGLDHEKVAIYVNNLGSVFHDFGEYERAKECYERALKIDEEAFGSDHPNVAVRVNNLGGVLKTLGEYERAKECYERALKIDEEAFSPDHPKVAIRVNNLGGVLHALGDYDGAKECFERALEIYEKTFGPDHPSVARDANNLGGVLHALGDYDGAKECFERALEIYEKTFGPDHPSVAGNVNNLGGVLHAFGEHERAKECYERALEIDKKTFGPDHPNVARDVNNLGGVLHALGERERAKECYERALEIFTKYLGADHPNTVAVRNNLKILASSQ